MENGKTVKIIIAAHKAYQMPEDEMYLPLHVGAEGKDLDLGFTKDNTGDNISSLNPSFCELTGLYWAWKNLDEDYLGLAHYRRHFQGKKNDDPFKSILTYDELKKDLGKIRIFVPTKRKYVIESLYSHYAHTHYAVQLDATRGIIEKKYPEYVESYDKVVNQTSGFMFNMMIMEKELFDDYCNWLFDILFTLKDELGANSSDSSPNQKIDMPELSAFQARFYGRISEIIFNVWLDYQIKTNRVKENQIKELKMINLEGEKWSKKIGLFLKAKYLGEKYEQSQ